MIRRFSLMTVLLPARILNMENFLAYMSLNLTYSMILETTYFTICTFFSSFSLALQ